MAKVCALGSARLLLVDRRNQALSALPPTIREHLAATRGGHAGAKAVRAGSADIVRLVRALHWGPRFRREKRAPDAPLVKGTWESNRAGGSLERVWRARFGRRARCQVARLAVRGLAAF